MTKKTWRKEKKSEPVIDPNFHEFGDTQYALCIGNPFHGFHFIGPFLLKESAVRYADDLSDDDGDRTWIIPLYGPIYESTDD